MAGRPPKSVKVLQMEGRSHFTKRQLATRERAEEGCMTGRRIREEPAVKADSAAHQEFLRVIRLLRLIEKDDDLYGAEINLYCRLKSELLQAEEQRDRLVENLDRFRSQWENFEDASDILAGAKIIQSLTAQVERSESRIQQKRKMRMDIEKNNLMNIASSLRSVSKASEKKKSPLAEALGG